MTPDVTTESQKIENTFRKEMQNPVQATLLWQSQKITYSDSYYRRGLNRLPVVRFSSGENGLRVHVDTATMQAKGVNLADGSRVPVKPSDVRDGMIVLSEQ